MTCCLQVIIPGSHRANYPLPVSANIGTSRPAPVGEPGGRLGTIQPTLRAGAVVFFMGGATVHGSVQWSHSAGQPRRCVLMNYLSKSTALSNGHLAARL
jgi:hypothetical protein